MEKKKILVIEDDEEMLKLTRLTLEHAGYEVSTCNDGHLALETVLKTKPDLLFLDVMLPMVDGYSISLALSKNEQTKDIPIIVLTSLEQSKNLFQKFPQVTGFMTKPFKADDLVKLAKDAFRKSSAKTLN